MKHAASISKEDEEEENRQAAKYPFMNEDEGRFSLIEPFKKFGVYLIMQLLRFFSYLTPANLKKQINNMKEKTVVELIIGFFKLILNSFIFSSSFIYSIVRYCSNIILRLMSGEALAGSQIKEEEEKNDTKEKLALQYVPPSISQTTVSVNGTQDQSTPTVKVTPANDQANKSPEVDKNEKNKEGQTNESRASISADSNKLTAENKNDVKSSSKSCLTEEAKKDEIKHSPTSKTSAQQQAVNAYEDESLTEIKDEQAPPALKSFSFNIRGYANRFICFLARNFYKFKNIALFIAFVINLILLCYKISTDINKGDIDGSGSIVGELVQNITESSEVGDLEATIAETISAEDLDSSEEGSEEDIGEEYVSLRENFLYLSPVLRLLALIHSILSLCLLIGYYQLKLPLVIFKREKEISRAMVIKMI